MATLQALRRQVRGAEDLQAVVSAMKSISAVRIRQFRGAVTALERYAETLELGLQIALRERPGASFPRPDPSAPRVAVVFGADQGLAGQFNANIVELARPSLREGSSVHVLAVGGRVSGQLEAEDFPVDEAVSAPGSVDGIIRVVQTLLVRIVSLREAGQAGQVTLFYNAFTGGASYEPRRTELLPLDPAWLDALRDRPWAGPSLPTFYTPWPELLTRLVREYLFIALYRACATSMASENASRLAAMEAAETRIDERLDDLRQRLNQARQGAITEELLDVVSGFEALGENDEDGRLVP
jgi:F-type H+-transporting ATPase subunit gamma